jgi:hypothetical protein
LNRRVRRNLSGPFNNLWQSNTIEALFTIKVVIITSLFQSLKSKILDKLNLLIEELQEVVEYFVRFVLVHFKS